MKQIFRISAVLFFAFGLFGCKVLSPSKPAVSSSSGEIPGRKEDFVLLPNGWSLRPTGRQVPMADFPVQVVVHPTSRFAAVLHCGYSEHEIRIVDLKTGTVVTRRPVEEAFYGLAFSRDGKQLYASGASKEVIRIFNFSNGVLGPELQVPSRSQPGRGIPAGLAVKGDGKKLYAANVWGQSISVIDLARKVPLREIRLGVRGEAPAAKAKQTGKFDLDAATKRAEADLDTTDPDAPFPYGCCLDEKQNRLYVSLWNRASVAVIDLKSNTLIGTWPAQEHPCEMVLSRSGRFLFVANANRNSVTVFDTNAQRPIETLFSSLTPTAPPGSTPNSVALSPDDDLLFVANADNNNIAVFDVSTPGQSRSLGFIPVGWYPTSVRVRPDGKQLLVVNGKGLSSKANPNGPQPGKKTHGIREYIAGLFTGTLSIIDLPDKAAFEEQMKDYTAKSYLCAPMKSDEAALATANNPIPRTPGGPTPLKNCIYIVKENRTYDQVLGDMREGNGDPNLCLFPEHVSPNHHRLAREFVLLDNFYVNSEVSADGHEWSMGAYATDFVEKTWPLTYGHNKAKMYPFPAEGRFKIASPANGYLWDRAKEAGVTYRSYGEFVECGRTPKEPAIARLAALRGHFDEWYRPFDLDYPDVKRAERFISELKRFEKEGEMPRLQIVRLPNDHTYGSTFGKPTPMACVADNDLALGKIVEAVSHSKFWPETAIFVVEDDAQNGPDHVDAHRTVAFVISPYTRRHVVDSTMYSTSGMLRTMELILGLKPMSQFDATATPMFNAFQSTPDLRNYAVVRPKVDLGESNNELAWGSKVSKKLDFSKEDAVDDLLLNELIWRSIRGKDSPAPAPIRAAFVMAHAKDDDDDD